MATKTKNTKKKSATFANPALAEGMRQIAQSGAWGTHDNRPHRERTRLASKTRAIREF